MSRDADLTREWEKTREALIRARERAKSQPPYSTIMEHSINYLTVHEKVICICGAELSHMDYVQHIRDAVLDEMVGAI